MLHQLDDLARNSQDSNSRPTDYAIPNTEGGLAALCEVNAPLPPFEALYSAFFFVFFFFYWVDWVD